MDMQHKDPKFRNQIKRCALPEIQEQLELGLLPQSNLLVQNSKEVPQLTTEAIINEFASDSMVSGAQTLSDVTEVEQYMED
jgi:hypothetical protein